MPDSDDRIIEGLRAMVERAPVAADVWDTTEKYVAKHRRQRIGAAAVVALVLAVATVGVAHAAVGSRRVAVESPPTTFPPATVPATVTSTAAPKVTTTTTPARAAAPASTVPVTATTVPTTTTAPAVLADACPANCIGRGQADVDGDGRLDNIGYMLTRRDAAPSKTQQQLRVVFATGQVANLDETGAIYPLWIGAADVDHDGKAELFYITTMGAHAYSGHIARWNGSALAVVTDGSGKPFVIGYDSYVFGVAGFGCTADGIDESSATFNGEIDKPGTWDGETKHYRWNGGALTPAGSTPIHFNGYASNQGNPRTPKQEALYGIDCRPLPRFGDSNLSP